MDPLFTWFCTQINAFITKLLVSYNIPVTENERFYETIQPEKLLVISVDKSKLGENQRCKTKDLKLGLPARLPGCRIFLEEYQSIPNLA